MEIGTGYGLYSWLEKKKKILMTHDTYIAPPRGSTTAYTILTKLGRLGEPRDVITLAKFLIERFLIIVSSVRGLSLPF